VIKYLGTGARRLESVTMKVSIAQTLLREALTSKQLRVEIYEPDGGHGRKSPNFKLAKEVWSFQSIVWLHSFDMS
jgi:DNA mismatch repair protein MSH2